MPPAPSAAASSTTPLRRSEAPPSRDRKRLRDHVGGRYRPPVTATPPETAERPTPPTGAAASTAPSGRPTGTSTGARDSRITGADGVRAFAALWVVASHLF